MKALGIFLIILCLAALGGVWYVHVTSNMNVFIGECVAEDPAKNPEEFERLKEQLENNSFTGIRFSSAPLTTPDEYIWYTWTVRMDNNTSIPARIAEIQVVPKDGGYDILQYTSLSEQTVPAKTSVEIKVRVLTSRSILNSGSQPTVRDFKATWYFWGLPFSASPQTLQ